jgi:hypothetical protein
LGLISAFLPRRDQAPWFSARRAVVLALAADVLALALIAGLFRAQEPVFGTATSVAPLPELEVQSRARLALLRTEVGVVAEAGPSRMGIALLTSEHGLLADHDANEPFVLASVSKVYILTAYLDLIAQGGRRPTETDMALMQDMIQWSDNDSASTLWTRLGGPEGLADFLRSRGLDPIWPVEEDAAWGTLAASPRQVADLLWNLMLGQLLDPESTQIAVAFLSKVDDEQRWGVSAGLNEPASTAFLKNGWYPEPEGWRLNSAGLVVMPEAEYVLVVLSDSSPTMEEGIERIEQVSRLINGYMASTR